jgi:very-short-patch-repair endonuclease
MRHRVKDHSRTFARSMRRRPTDAERRLWHRLRDGQLDGIRFRRQVPIGNAIADFVCYERMLIVELDGSQHADSAAYARRDAELRRRGFRILRFWNTDALLNPEGVLETILATARSLPPHPFSLNSPAAR